MLPTVVRERYARCERYEDRGEVLQKKEPWGTFTTRFLRALDSLFFVFTSKNGSAYSIDVRRDAVSVTFPPKLGDQFAAAFLGPNPRPSDVLTRFARITGTASIIVPSLLRTSASPGLDIDSRAFIVDPTTGLLARFIDAPQDLVINYQPTIVDPGARVVLDS